MHLSLVSCVVHMVGVRVVTSNKGHCLDFYQGHCCYIRPCSLCFYVFGLPGGVETCKSVAQHDVKSTAAAEAANVKMCK